jgi:hypothetical protein
MKTGSFSVEDVEYTVYLTALLPGAESWAIEDAGRRIDMINKK